MPRAARSMAAARGRARSARSPWHAWAVAGALALAALLPAARSRAAGVPALEHVIVVVMENKNDDQVRSAPAFAQLIRSGASFSDYRAIRHPSQPNYIALWAGTTQGVTSNGCPLKGTPWMSENLGHLCEQAGLAWRSYSEDLPAAGSSVCKAARGRYSRKHNPWTNYGNLDHDNQRPYTDLAGDIQAGKLPALAFVIPNNDHNMHNRPVSYGDAWLASNMPAMLDAVGPRGVVVLTFDENDSGPTNQILTVIVGPTVKAGFVSTRRVTHYTLLRTICDALRLRAPGAAATESPIADIWVAGAPGADGAPDAAAPPGK